MCITAVGGSDCRSQYFVSIGKGWFGEYCSVYIVGHTLPDCVRISGVGFLAKDSGSFGQSPPEKRAAGRSVVSGDGL